MTIPQGAILEATHDYPNGDPGIAVYSVAHLLDAEAAKVRRGGAKKYGVRNPRYIDTCIIHKSGANGPAGFTGALATMRYVVANRGWWGAAYTFWVSREADRDETGRIVVYRCQPDDIRSWHTGGRMNGVGIGIGVQGNYDGQWDLLSNGLPKIDREPTADQWAALPLLVEWVVQKYPDIILGREDDDDDWGLTGHWEHGKPVCPGDALRHWVLQTRGELEPSELLPFDAGPDLPQACVDEVDPFRFTPKRYQKALLVLGFDPGPIDGKPGVRTRSALERFQRSNRVKADGWYGPATAAALQAALRRTNLASKQAFDDHPPKL